MQISVIYNGVDESDVTSQERDKVFTMLAVGRLDRIKGFDLLIKAAGRLEFPFRLLVVGEGPEQNELFRLISELNLQESVTLTGFREDVCQMMHNSDVVIMSLYREGFSMVIIEAIFYTPVLLSTPAGVAVELLPEMFLFEHSHLAEKIADLYRNYTVYTDRFERFRLEKAESFRLSNTIHSYEVLYSRMLDR